MAPRSHAIPSHDFERLVSKVAADIWNQLIENPSFSSMSLRFYADIFEAVKKSLSDYQQRDRKIKRRLP